MDDTQTQDVAVTLDDKLNAIYTSSDAAAQDTDPVAAEEAAAPEPEAVADETADAQKESTEEAADPTSEADKEEQPEPSADFSDLLSDIPTDEALKQITHRIPEASKAEVFKLRDGWQADRNALNDIGGTEGVETLKPFADLLTKAEPTEADFAQTIHKTMTANPIAIGGLIETGASKLLFNTSPTPEGKALARIGDSVLTERFGADSAHLEKLVMLEKSGYINVDESMENLNLEGSASTLFQSQKAEIERLKAEASELKELVDNPDRIPTQSNSAKELDTALEAKIAAEIAPFCERINWKPEDTLTKTVMSALMAEIKAEPGYKEALKFASNGATGYPVDVHTDRLVNKVKAQFSIVATSIQQDLKGVTEKSLNATRQKESQKEAKKPAPVALEAVPVGSFNGLLPVDEKLQAIYNRSNAAKAG